MKYNLKNKKVFITGSNGAIGQSIKKQFLENGAIVTSPGRDELNLYNQNDIIKYFSKLSDNNFDIFIHCAGINEISGVNEMDFDILNRSFMVNVSSAAIIMKYLNTHMVENKWGRVVFISSLYAIISKEKRIAYSSSKNALTGLMKSLSLELAEYNIMINSIAPGYIFTEMTKKNLSEKEIEEIEKNTPTNRLQTTKEIADLTIFMCSDLNQSITGQLIAVDGGFTLK